MHVLCSGFPLDVSVSSHTLSFYACRTIELVFLVLTRSNVSGFILYSVFNISVNIFSSSRYIHGPVLVLARGRHGMGELSA